MNHSTTKSKNSNMSTQQLLGPIKVFHPNVLFDVVGDKLYRTSTYLSELSIEQLKKELDYTTVEKQIIFTIPLENASYQYKSPTVLLCAYNATNQYLESILGTRLDKEDEIWFCQHPLVESQGLPQKHTVTVINELVKPYNIGISKIFVRKGCSINEELQHWQRVLGVNPKAKFSSQISNLDYFKSICGDNEALLEELIRTQSNQFCFEYVDLPKMPAIIFNQTVSTSFAVGGGHSNYYSPRSMVNPDSWRLAIQLDRLNVVNRFIKPIETNYEAKLEKTLDIYKCKTKTGKLIESILFQSPFNKSYSNNFHSPNNNYNHNNVKQKPQPNTLNKLDLNNAKLLPQWATSREKLATHPDYYLRELEDNLEEKVDKWLTEKFKSKDYKLSDSDHLLFGKFLNEWSLDWTEITARFAFETNSFLPTNECKLDAKEALDDIEYFIAAESDRYNYYGADTCKFVDLLNTNSEIGKITKNDYLSVIASASPRTLLGIAYLGELIDKLDIKTPIEETIVSTRNFIIEECLTQINYAAKHLFAC